jgi:hypothetical protein
VAVWPRTELSQASKKSLASCTEVTVPQTDSGRRGEYPKARGRTLAKELGKMTP